MITRQKSLTNPRAKLLSYKGMKISVRGLDRVKSIGCKKRSCIYKGSRPKGAFSWTFCADCDHKKNKKAAKQIVKTLPNEITELKKNSDGKTMVTIRKSRMATIRNPLEGVPAQGKKQNDTHPPPPFGGVILNVCYVRIVFQLSCVTFVKSRGFVMVFPGIMCGILL